MLSVCVGIDGGGTKCEGCVVDDTGRVMATFTGPSSNHNAVGWPAAIASLSAVWEGLRAAMPLTQTSISVKAAMLGMSGVDKDRPEAIQRWQLEAARIFGVLETGVVVSNDAETALASGLERGQEEQGGVVLIAGTGTICVGISEGGKERARSQGWGPLMGDRGSGNSLGAEAAAAVMRAYDGLGPPCTELTRQVFAIAKIQKTPELVSWMYADGGGWARVATLAPAVEISAKNGDLEANRILNEAAEALSNSVKAVSAKLKLSSDESSWTLVVTGGLLRPGGPLQDLLRPLVASLGAHLVHPLCSSAQAAARLALNRAAFQR